MNFLINALDLEKINNKIYLVLSLLGICLLTSCTKYIEKQSEPLSASTYATSDSIKAGRFDLAAKYSDQTILLVAPPKHRIPISPLYKSIKGVDNQTHKETISLVKYVVVPESLKDDKVLVVNSDEYKALQKDSKIAQQLKKENEVLVKQDKVVSEERTKQAEIHSQLLKDYNAQKTALVHKDLVILRLWIGIIVLGVLLAAMVYIFVKPPLFL